MDIKLGQNIKIEQRQELVMTPELIQSIQILQFNAVELETYVQEQMQSNPLLEKKEIDWQQYLKNRRNDSVGQKYSEYADPDREQNSYEQYTSMDTNLVDHLMFQLDVSAKSKEEIRIGEFIIESLDEKGYRTLTVKEIAKATGASTEAVKKVLKMIYTFEPYGVGAANLAECLMIQLNAIGMLDHNYKELLARHIDDLSANRLKTIAKAMRITIEEVQQMADVIRKLDPKPGLQFASKDDNRYIVPELFVEEVDGKFVVTMNDGSTPQLMISSYYDTLVAEAGEDQEVLKYLKNRLDQALWVINSINRRKETIHKVAQEVVSWQEDFFRHGSKHLKILTLKNIAEKLDIHESTVSRTVNGKYLQCKAGVFELKHFFSSGVAFGGNTEGISSTGVKCYIKEMIDSENTKKPFSDQRIADMLKEKDIDISRRTVAKYREEMGIASSSGRKRY